MTQRKISKKKNRKLKLVKLEGDIKKGVCRSVGLAGMKEKGMDGKPIKIELKGFKKNKSEGVLNVCEHVSHS